MRSIFLFLSLLLTISCVKNNRSIIKKEFTIIQTSEIKRISFDDFIKKISSYDIIIFGEKHDDAYTHNLEFLTFNKLVKKNKKVALSLEMFETDVQHIMDSFLLNHITEEEFLKRSRPWPNYDNDYRRIVLLAKENRLSVIASNIPRKFASIVSKEGKDSLLKIENIKNFIFEPANDMTSYKEKFFQFMSQILPQSPMGHLNDEKTFLAQLFKDATMAGSIKNFLLKNKDYKVYHLCGEFHSNHHLGIYTQLKAILPEKKIVTIAVVDSQNFDPTQADFLFIR